MTPQQRQAEIAARVAATTQGPYRVQADGGEGYAICSPYDEQGRMNGWLDKVVANCERYEDAVFFKDAAPDTRWLLERIAKLEAALEDAMMDPASVLGLHDADAVRRAYERINDRNAMIGRALAAMPEGE
jgi:hypothetical protein